MTRRTQCVVLTLVATLGIRLVVSDLYLRYVHTWMRWPILLTSVLLLVVALRLALARPAHPDDDRVPPSTWLLVLPVVAVFTISPPALGAYAAERSAAAVTDDSGFDPLPARDLTTLTVSEFTARAQWGDTLRGRAVAMTGFVSKRADGSWFVTRLGISCCAADAIVYRVRVSGLAAPPRDRWVRVTGTWQDPGAGRLPRTATPTLAATGLDPVTVPTDPYE